MMIDTHAHLSLKYYDNLDEIIKKMKDGIIIISGSNHKENLSVLELVNKYDNVYGVIGIHPTELEDANNKSFVFIDKNVNNPKIVGIGEIGLDYHYGKENVDKQRELFIKQIKMAKKYNKTIVIHSRDAMEDTYNIINKYGSGIRKVMHCYSGSLEMAEKFIKLGVHLGIGGVLTFKNASKLNEVVKSIDLNYLVLETDSPYLTPEPLRGKKNEPYNIIYVAQKIAEIKKMTVREILNITANNAIKLFDLKISI